jgi:hypothetical protein
MYQVTNATFQDARHYCIHGHVVVEDGVVLDGPDRVVSVMSSCELAHREIRAIPR